jgi:thiol-disulfide isomerase/thioredoxin
MNKFLYKHILIIISLISLTGASSSESYDISLDSIDDSRHKLSDYIGHSKWVVLNIWGTRCPPCREEMPELVSFHDAHKNSNGIVIGIAIDFPSYGYAKKSEVADFADDYLIDFPVLLSDSTITEKIGLGRLQALPSTYLFDPDGKVVGMQVGAITKKILEDFINKLKLQSPNSDKYSIPGERNHYFKEEKT